MLETAESEDGKSDTTAMTAALKSKGGQRVASLFAKKAKALKVRAAGRHELESGRGSTIYKTWCSGHSSSSTQYVRPIHKRALQRFRNNQVHAVVKCILAARCSLIPCMHFAE